MSAHIRPNENVGLKPVGFCLRRLVSDTRLLSDDTSTASIAPIILSHSFGYYGTEGQVTRNATRQLEHFPLQ